jgi:hypothetical protein
MNIPLGISGFYDLALRNARTGEVWQLGRVKNLITDAGFDAPARYAFVKCFEVIAVGTGRTAAKTADTKLEAFVAKSTTYATGGSTINGINFPNAADGDYTVRELFRTFLAYQNRSGAAVAIGELGVSWENVDNPMLFSRIVLTDAVSVPDGFDLLVRYTLRFQLPKDIFRTWKATTLRIGSVDVAGKLTMAAYYYKNDSSIYFGLSCINADGTSANVITGTGTDAGRAHHFFGLLEPSAIGYGMACGIDNGTSDDATYCSSTSNIMGGTLQDYVAGSGRIVKRYSFPASKLTGRTDLRTIAVGQTGGNNGYLSGGNNAYAHQIRFQSDAVFTKAATVQWDIDLTLTWARA